MTEAATRRVEPGARASRAASGGQEREEGEGREEEEEEEVEDEGRWRPRAIAPAVASGGWRERPALGETERARDVCLSFFFAETRDPVYIWCWAQ